jgi:hypothetical protein
MMVRRSGQVELQLLVLHWALTAEPRLLRQTIRTVKRIALRMVHSDLQEEISCASFINPAGGFRIVNRRLIPAQPRGSARAQRKT